MPKGEALNKLEDFKKELNDLLDKYFKEDGIIELKPEKKPSKVEDLRKIVLTFKIVSGYEKDDRKWDSMFYSRYMKSAKELLNFMGDWRMACDCIQDVYEKLASKGLTVTFETIVKHSADWKRDYLELEGKRGGLPSQGDGNRTVDGRGVNEITSS